MITEYVGICLVLPFVLSFAVSWATGTWLVPKSGIFTAFAIGFGGGVIAASCALFGNQILRPDRHWEWLPAVAVLALIAGAVSGSKTIGGWERSAWLPGLSVALAWLLVPTWKSIEDYRILLIASLAATHFVATSVTIWLSQQVQTSKLSIAIAAAFFVGAAIIGIDLSLTNSRWLLIGGSALLGCILAQVVQRKNVAGEIVPGLPAAFAWLVGGLFVGGVDPSPMRLELLGIALSPLAFGAVMIAIADGKRVVWREIVAWLAVALVIAVVLIVYFLRR